MSTRTVLTKSSRNVFADLGFPEGEAQNLALRSDLMIRIEKLVRDSGMTQQQAAKTLGVTQPRLNALLKGKIADFSLHPSRLHCFSALHPSLLRSRSVCRRRR
jgi:predicted XRE-type DNA-binding protein